MTQEELEDLIAEAIDDSMDMDWTSRDGARAVAEALVIAGVITPDDHPNAEDYRTRAERAEAELAEVRAGVEGAVRVAADLAAENQRLRTALQWIADAAYVDHVSGNHNFEYLQQCAEGALKSNNPEITHDCNELVHILEAITAMQALRYGDATRTHMALIGLCVTAHTAPSGDVERVARAIKEAQCNGREGPFGGYDYGHNTAFYGPEPEGGRYVIRDFRDPASPDWGKWLHQTNDSEDHERMFAKMTQEHIAKAAIAAMREHMLPSPDTPPVAKSESPVVSDTAAQLAEAQREIDRLREALEAAIKAITDPRGLDDAICCSGHMCGCRGASHRDLLLNDLETMLARAALEPKP